MCFGAAVARPRLNVCVKDAIKQGMITGPRTLSNSQETSTTGGAIIPGITKFADGVHEMRKVVPEFLALGIDNVKLSMTGDYVHEFMGSKETYFTLEETKAAVEEALKPLSAGNMVLYASSFKITDLDFSQSLRNRGMLRFLNDGVWPWIV
ncbi:hypothetical protein DTO207G8_7563 [Paecilomyces variotii]|nr:hypothetical protein DTO207G8_7563 [Paecilomyces variotii]